MNKKLAPPSIALIAIVLPGTLWAYNDLPTSGPMPDVVHVRKDCASTNSNISNCADNMAEMMSWVWNTRNPDVSSPLMVDVGPGTFGRFTCTDAGYVTIRGSGRDKSILQSGVKSPVNVNNCTKLSFQDIKISSDNTAIVWREGGDSSYSNVEVVSGPSYQNWAWRDSCVGLTKSIHYWFGSKLTSRADGYGATFETQCSESWFYGSEITVAVEPGPQAQQFFAVDVLYDGDVRLFGSAVRAFSETGVIFGAGREGPVGARVSEGGVFHMHGGIISIDASKANGNVGANGLIVDSTSAAHVVDTAYALKVAGQGIATRIAGQAASPFQWPQSTTPPNVVSITGADTYVETDCAASGCQTVGAEPHLMIYSAACTGAGGPWFDVVTRACR